ncbi:uncharacterized protein LOC117320859 [Pecten maximus]|uniref:uncharacterized protein LOC117320859 n=1 Tax=Pecten maximus TaxID=6579 RepID=UPI001458F185|nr:uncharacterized protein LOC117320859 [Pecten maximus]
MAMPVLILGHSYIRRLDQMTNDFRLDCINFGLDGTRVQVYCYGLGGGTICPGPKSLQHKLTLLRDIHPKIVILQCGGNDLSRECDVNELARKIINFASLVMNAPSVQRVVIGQLLPRFSQRLRHSYNEDVVKLNLALEAMASKQDFLSFWHHRGFWANPRPLYARDTVHLNEVGMRKYYRSMKAAIVFHSRRM